VGAKSILLKWFNVEEALKANRDLQGQHDCIGSNDVYYGAELS